MRRAEGLLKARVSCSLLCAIVISLIALSPLPAASEPGAEEGEEEVRFWGFRHLSGGLELRFESERDRETGLGAEFETERISFEERFNLSSQGYIYHPNFLEYTSSSSLGMRQEMFDGSSGSSSGNNFLSEFDMNATIFKQKPVNAYLFASQTSIPVSNQFFDMVTVDTINFGGLLRYQNDRVPMSLLLQDQNTKESSLDFDRDRTERSAEYRAANKLANILNSDFRYEYKDLVENYPTSQEILSHTLSLDNSLDYKSIHGFSNISAVRTSGLFSTDTLQVNENFHADHAGSLRSFYGYNLAHYASDDFQSDTSTGSAGIHHRLFDSLDTELRCELSRTSATDFQELSYGPRFSLSYHKNVPGGVLSAGYDFLYRHVDREASTGLATAIGERIVLSDPRRTFLVNPDVVLDSVIVRDTSGIILTLDVDYRLIQRGVLTEIQRLALPDNTTVLVDYDYALPRTLIFDTFGNRFNLRYDFRSFLSFYYAYQSTTQEGVSGDQTGGGMSSLADTVKSLYGIESRWRWLSLTAEYEKDDSDLVPFSSWRLRGTFDISPTDRSHLSLTATHNHTGYEEDNRVIDFSSAEAYYSLHINTLLDAGVAAGYLRETGWDLDTSIWRFRGDIRSRFRSLELKLQPEYLMRHEIGQDRGELLIKFSIIRYFTIF